MCVKCGSENSNYKDRGICFLCAMEQTDRVHPEQAPLDDIHLAHEMEKKVLYEALERALSHFEIMGGTQAIYAAKEVGDVLNGRAAKARFSFDDLNFGITKTGLRIDTPIAPRPKGLTSTEWYEFAGRLVNSLNRQGMIFNPCS